jgi:hypothetical protein
MHRPMWGDPVVKPERQAEPADPGPRRRGRRRDKPRLWLEIALPLLAVAAIVLLAVAL